jgi:hypothetical protein
MHDRSNLMLAENAIQQLRIAQIPLNEGSAHQKVAMPTREIIQDNNLMTGMKQIQRHVRANITRAAYDKNGFSGHDGALCRPDEIVRP